MSSKGDQYRLPKEKLKGCRWKESVFERSNNNLERWVWPLGSLALSRGQKRSILER